ncbi:hypothetical protein JYA63_07080 [Fictibacillus nanhaiensis]|uniref:Lipoprotein n=1 Tax=Fictibacillus nanhaiensis TaxID=742169 RepID=A0ABS2ZMB5_9BACL|nr:hypothetical protein [Fictibacillus nanhaiensis]
MQEGKINKMKRLVYGFCYMIAILILCVGCNDKEDTLPSSQKQDTEIKADKPTSIDTLVKEEMSSTQKDTIKSVTRVKDWNLNEISNTSFKLNNTSCKMDSLVAPAYADANKIIFLSYGENNDVIYEFSTLTNQCKEIYKSKGIGNLVGNEGFLFWTEYDTKQLSNVEWSIKGLDLLENKVTNIATGGSYKDTPTPTMKLGYQSINWIEYEIQGEKVISKVKNYNYKKREVTTLSEALLNESEERKGEYYILQEGINTEEQILLYKSVFKNGNKEFTIDIQKNGEPIQNLLTQNGVLDFISNNKYFVYTGEGHLTYKEILNPASKSVFETGNKLTTDTPIFVGKHSLVFRYAMNELYLINMKENKSYSLTGYTSLVSKPVYTNGFLAYGIKTGEQEKEEITFYLLKIDEK